MVSSIVSKILVFKLCWVGCGLEPTGYQGCVKELTRVLQPVAPSLYLCFLQEFSPPCSQFELVGISIAQSNQQNDQLLLAFELYQGTFNQHSFSNRTFRSARQYNGATKPSCAPRTLLQDAELNLFSTLNNCAVVWLEGLSLRDHHLQLELSAGAG